MDGRYPNGHFYRPVTTLSFALDHAVWGLDPSGYHLTDLALLLACAIGVAALARRLLGPGRRPAGGRPLVRAASAPRRDAAGGGAPRRHPGAALHADRAAGSKRSAQRAEGERSGRRGSAGAVPARRALCALASALAVGSKESGSIVVPLLLALGFAEPVLRPVRERLRRSLRASALPIAAVGLVLLVRTRGAGRDRRASRVVAVREPRPRPRARADLRHAAVDAPAGAARRGARAGARDGDREPARRRARGCSRGIRLSAACCSSAASGCSAASG